MIVGDRLQARLSSLGYTVAQLVNTNFQVVLDSGRARSRMGTQVAEDLQPRYAELFASGEPIVITPFKMQVPETPCLAAGWRRPGTAARALDGWGWDHGPRALRQPTHPPLRAP